MRIVSVERFRRRNGSPMLLLGLDMTYIQAAKAGCPGANAKVLSGGAVTPVQGVLAFQQPLDSLATVSVTSPESVVVAVGDTFAFEGAGPAV